jgi:hypothetical protein
VEVVEAEVEVEVVPMETEREQLRMVEMEELAALGEMEVESLPSLLAQLQITETSLPTVEME